MTALKPTVLIGSSRHFIKKALFESKVKKILSHLGEYEIVAVGEENGLAHQLFGTLVKETIPYTSKPHIVNKAINQSTFIIMFWDGTDIDEFVYQALLSKKRARIIPVETTKVANKDKGEPFNIYIGRGSPWGNPFAIGDDGMNREQAIHKFDVYFRETILTNEEKRRGLLDLRGKILGCHCKPYPCHGDIIAHYLNSLEYT